MCSPSTACELGELWLSPSPLTGDWWVLPKKPAMFVNSLSQAVWFYIQEMYKAFWPRLCSCWFQHAKPVLARWGAYWRIFCCGISLTFDAYFMHFMGFTCHLTEARTTHSGWGFSCKFLQNQGAYCLLCYLAWLGCSDLKSMRLFLNVLCGLRYE